MGEKKLLTKKQMQSLLKELEHNWQIILGEIPNDTFLDDEGLLSITQRLEHKYFKNA